MLIQDQSQKKSGRSMNPEMAQLKGNVDNDVEMEQEIVKVKTEINVDPTDVEMTDLTENDSIADSSGGDNEHQLVPKDYFEKEINIDPRTYCKLGHYHLLLEDYEKGKIRKQNDR